MLPLFQPELRRGLEQIGRSKVGAVFNFEFEKSKLDIRDTIEEIVQSCGNMSKQKIGSLIVIELETKIGEVIESGTRLNSDITSELLDSIFSPNTPLHDGAVIIRDNKVKAAACFLPLTDNVNLNRALGTRHRAALGISEVSDAIAIIVSEETGTISIARNGILKRNLSSDILRKQLHKYLLEDDFSVKKLGLWKVKKSAADK